MVKHLNIFFNLYLFSAISLLAQPIPVENLHHHVDGLNIEGGLIPQKILTHPQVWGNMTAILDRPVITGECLDKITSENKYALKEASIMEYDEFKVNHAYALILKYYLTNARKIAQATTHDDQIHMTIQIHRNSSAPAQFALFEEILDILIQSHDLQPLPLNEPLPGDIVTYYYYAPQNCIIEFRKGVYLETASNYSKSNIILCFGLAAGLNPSYPSSSLLLPEKFIPYKIDSSDVIFDEEYEVKNHIRESLQEILEQDIAPLQIIESMNPEKISQFNGNLTQDDFIVGAKILQADKMFYPKSSSTKK